MIRHYPRLDVSNSQFCYFYENGKRIGATRFDSSYEEGKEIYIIEFTIYPSFRGLGLGKKFFGLLLSRLKKKFRLAQKISLFAFKDGEVAVKIYSSFGFKEIDYPSSYLMRMELIL